MQNKAKVKMGKIKPIHVFARAGSLTITVCDFTRGNLSPYKGVLCKTKQNSKISVIKFVNLYKILTTYEKSF